MVLSLTEDLLERAARGGSSSSDDDGGDNNDNDGESTKEEDADDDDDDDDCDEEEEKDDDDGNSSTNVAKLLAMLAKRPELSKLITNNDGKQTASSSSSDNDDHPPPSSSSSSDDDDEGRPAAAKPGKKTAHKKKKKPLKKAAAAAGDNDDNDEDDNDNDDDINKYVGGKKTQEQTSRLLLSSSSDSKKRKFPPEPTLRYQSMVAPAPKRGTQKGGSSKSFLRITAPTMGWDHKQPNHRELNKHATAGSEVNLENLDAIQSFYGMHPQRFWQGLPLQDVATSLAQGAFFFEKTGKDAFAQDMGRHLLQVNVTREQLQRARLLLNAVFTSADALFKEREETRKPELTPEQTHSLRALERLFATDEPRKLEKRRQEFYDDVRKEQQLLKQLERTRGDPCRWNTLVYDRKTGHFSQLVLMKQLCGGCDVMKYTLRTWIEHRELLGLEAEDAVVFPYKKGGVWAQLNDWRTDAKPFSKEIKTLGVPTHIFKYMPLSEYTEWLDDTQVAKAIKDKNARRAEVKRHLFGIVQLCLRNGRWCTQDEFALKNQELIRQIIEESKSTQHTFKLSNVWHAYNKAWALLLGVDIFPPTKKATKQDKKKHSSKKKTTKKNPAAGGGATTTNSSSSDSSSPEDDD